MSEDCDQLKAQYEAIKQQEAMKCHVCGKAPWDGINMYRQNPKGGVGVWACAAHSTPVDDTLVNIVAALQKGPKVITKEGGNMNYEPLHRFATDNRVSYNELCTAVHEALLQWQPIETAPKDGSKYLVWAGGIGTAYYRQGYSEAYGPFSDNLSAWKGRPTHWMLMPKGPL